MSALGKVVGELVAEVEKRNAEHMEACRAAGCRRETFCEHTRLMTRNLVGFFGAVDSALAAERIFDAAIPGSEES